MDAREGRSMCFNHKNYETMYVFTKFLDENKENAQLLIFELGFNDI